ncbi:DUF1345 domain-containing protein [Sphingomonas astaxanthinifaciens]|uniref:DUF1345 domain-containing protein n=1 Tax=Sphingomonas astaxanthinifaciens DSM 22298 TaxID=1123267 RepID=A0ABQ5Z7S0_9SPHN|nr:DUF1345 domain-containing protein [Sphingomonas astaxanthinifaciens]GLR47576.1 hypothetical protein GCM10007925_12880 [Sphingomonas astaxanthinifaciens DSM 22298]
MDLTRLFPPRFLLFFAIMLVGGAIMVPLWGWERGGLGAFDLAAATFILSLWPIFNDSPDKLLADAKRNDANRGMLLAVSTVLGLVVGAATVSLLSEKQSLGLADKGLVTGSLVLLWFFANAVFALHYVFLFATQREGGGGLDFPGKEPPTFSDFVHFATTIGVAMQTADIQITARAIRRIVTVQAITGFFFNLFVLALTVNVLAGS